jgi:hypothetical protein
VSYNGRHRHTWVANVKLDLNERECEGVDWIHLTQDRVQLQALVNMAMNLQVP